MGLLATVVLDLVLAFTLLFSVQIAAGWGELCGIRPGRDKSGLGGFAMLLMFFLVRWLALALCLAALSAGAERWWLLAGHGGLGWVSVTMFNRGVARVQADGTVGHFAGVVGSTLIPAPACTLALQRANVAWLGDSPAALAAVAAIVVLLHFACYRQRRSSMLASRA